ncbi:hypothetical protein H4Q26_012744 [Puccinia striiformis f. sp. tritici PST-130]|nr:hypothetical protein H4Q26_012744 [Puccinia striiformis f. sp. tritici PST-130]
MLETARSSTQREPSWETGLGLWLEDLEHRSILGEGYRQRSGRERITAKRAKAGQERRSSNTLDPKKSSLATGGANTQHT